MEMQKCLYKLLLILALLTPFSLVGCGPQEKGPSIPPVNAHPVEKITFAIDIDTMQTDKTYELVGISVLYTTPVPGCGYTDYTRGGVYMRPKSEINFANNGNVVTIYRDYFQPRQTCPFIISQVIIDITDRAGRSAAVNINDLVIGSVPSIRLKSKCEFQSTIDYYLCDNEGDFGFDRPRTAPSFMVNVQRL